MNKNLERFYNCTYSLIVAGETLEQCAIRECQEEAGVSPIKLSKHSFYEYEGNTYKTISHLFTGSIDNNIQKSEFISWFTIEDLNNSDIAFDYIFSILQVINTSNIYIKGNLMKYLFGITFKKIIIKS